MTNEHKIAQITEVAQGCLDRISLMKGKWMPHQKNGDAYKELVKLEGLIETTKQMAERGELPADRLDATIEELEWNLPILQNSVDKMF